MIDFHVDTIYQLVINKSGESLESIPKGLFEAGRSKRSTTDGDNRRPEALESGYAICIGTRTI